MEELGFSLKRTLSIMGIAGLLMCSTALLSHRADTVPGLLIGIVTSCLYYMLLHYQIKKSATMTPAQVEIYLKKGACSRFCLVLVGIALVFRDPGTSVVAFLVGILLPFRCVLLLNSIELLRKEFSEVDHTQTPENGTSISHPLLHGRGYAWERIVTPSKKTPYGGGISGSMAYLNTDVTEFTGDSSGGLPCSTKGKALYRQ